MKANEFIKKQGLAEARRVLRDARGCVGVKLWGRYEFSTEDLKRLVESHELVFEHGSIDRARKYADSPYTAPEIKVVLDKAIADVESCQ